MIGKDFILSGRGNKKHPGAIFTLDVSNRFQDMHKTKPHYTYKITYRSSKGRWDEVWFVSLLTGPDNTYDYSYIGILNPLTGELILSGKSPDEKTWGVRFAKRILSCLWRVNGASIDDLIANDFKLYHEGRCGRCGKRLTTPHSIETGIGPICQFKL